MLGVQHAAQLGQGRLQVQLLEGAVGHSFHRISCVYFSLENNS